MSFEVEGLNISVISSKSDEKRILVKDLNLKIKKEEILLIQGVSGSGKSTLLKAIAGFIPTFYSNKLPKKTGLKRNWFEEDYSNISCTGVLKYCNSIINDLDPRERGFGFLMQNTRVYPHLKTPKEILLFPFKYNKSLRNKFSREEYETRAVTLFEMLGLNIGFEDEISALSGGEEQRLNLAKQLLTSPGILLLDEPFSNLDYVQKHRLREFLKKLIKENSEFRIKSIIMVSHDIEDTKFADQILYIKGMNGTYEIIKGNQFESTNDIFQRKFGVEENENGLVLKENVINSLIRKNSNHEILNGAINDFLSMLGLNQKQKKGFMKVFFHKHDSDIDLERKLKNYFDIIGVDKSIIYNEINQRSKIVAKQVEEFIAGDKVLDFGCGDCSVASLLKNRIPTMHFADIFETLEGRVSEEIAIQLNIETDYYQVKNNRLELPDDSYDTVLLLTVLHHSNDPIQTLREAYRISKKRIIIIESVLGISDSEPGVEELKLNSADRIVYARIVDWMYNRLLFEGVQVTYNFLSVEDWKTTFEDFGLKILHEKNLGIDVPIIKEHHYLFVLEK